MAIADGIKVCIAVPSSDYVPSYFAMALAGLIQYQSPKTYVRLINQMGSLIADNRLRLLSDARQLGATHILYIDADMTFPLNALELLLEHDLDIVCATAPRRTDNDGLMPIGTPLHQDEVTSSKRLVEMAEVGMCMMLIKMSVFEKLPQPCFAYPVINGQMLGEDFYFCHLARQSGFRIWCDMGLSFAMGHVGTKIYKVESIEQREAKILRVA